MKSLSSIQNAAACLLLVVLVFLAFGGALGNGFVRFDDHGYVTENPIVRVGLSKVGLGWAFTTRHMFNWHPLTWLSHMTDVEAYGLEPMGHHLTSLLLHAANAVLLFWVLRGMTGRFGPALAVAALWAVHPLRVESVAWVSERKDVLAGFFALLAMWAYSRRERKAMVWVTLGFALSLMAKPTWVTLPFILLLLDAWPLRRWPERKAWTLVAEKWPLFALTGLSCAATYLVQQAGGAVRSWTAHPLGERLVNAVLSYWDYLRALVRPTDLGVFYPYRAGETPAWVLAVAIAGLAALTVLAIRAFRRRPWWTVGWLWFLGTLVPMIGLVQVGGQAWADRYSYLPHIGLLLAIVWGVAEWSLRMDEVARKWVLGSLVTAVVAVLAAMSRTQTTSWHDTESLFLRTLAATEDNALIEFNLANWYQQEGLTDDACVHYRETLRILPDYVPALNNMAWALAADPVSTPEQAREALGLAQRSMELSGANRAALLNTLERAQAACGEYEAALETARELLALAEEGGHRETADKIRWRMGLYRARALKAEEE